ncbi:phosphoglycerate dehydrogenase [Mesorhizobium sp. CA18]|uniref:NAD(P)-dependent oxidoreductase n=1 Tax=unclassified Mesorhizobium TaxID=325217 RepID=UPI001CCFF98D|nr:MULTISPECIES: NAD(P)-dependent oxidoreductase [unclassified Mesorhizobium]MBZ9735579.1 phosphoglycerate dehydrogenase [Mesorhizobium sp. CA9]MBZ9826419.1 phosphoglycerate dehydrogenase [Mesorhizobium sp. CA18]MBZ9831542.1 phosphoglycerate dehydrogenase [Mesorhizobium sp. CA2]MBZ9837945.1 phosphoglycerate dehydrogenase [Mesorhizobium sp. CA3]MBZ9878529.1 phosphoglycerate dehydrogenase [Mesorhizobium sp. Ca11]
MTSANILICDFVGLRFGADGNPDHSEVKAYIEAKGGVFHQTGIAEAGPLDPDRLHFFYLPQLSTRDELLAEAGDGRYDAVIAAATFIPAETRFRLGGVRIGAGTGNMGSASWGGGSGEGGEAPLMNTPGINSRATAQMAMKALLKVRPDLPVDKLNTLVAGGQFDTGKDLRHYPTEKLEGKRLAVIGYGNIGREFARLGQAFGMRVIIHARSRHHKWIEAEGFHYEETMEDAARGADALSVHLGLGPFDAGQQRYANAGLIGDEVLSLLNHGAVLINYDRGELVDVAALERALASGRVSHAAIDADLFKDGSTLSGPMLPYLRLVEAYGQRLELLPHAAADTDHPSRVAGAKQAVDQIYAAIVEHRVHNLKGSLPPGFLDMGAKVPPGIGGVNPQHLAALAGDQNAAADLARSGALVAAFWERILAAPEQERPALIASGGETFAEAANHLSTLLRRHHLSGPFTSGSL